tara:strand:+ start:359 stop:1384 length:1026 start_codon:yes stop_codon:yes gene_type:complete
MDYLNLLVDTKKEFSIYLINNLSPEINKGIFSIFENCKTMVQQNNNILMSFQQVLSDVPNWQSGVVYTETMRIKDKIPYIEDLLTAVFISNMRLLCSIKNKNKQIKVKVPKLETFIHKCYIEVAKEFWTYTYLFNDNINKLEVQKNKRQIDMIIKNSIEEVVRKLLPLKTILKDYLETNLDTDANDESQVNNSLVDIIKDTINQQKDKIVEKHKSSKHDTSEEDITEKKYKNNDNYDNDNNDDNDNINKDMDMEPIVVRDSIGMDAQSEFNFDENLFLNTISNDVPDEPNVLYHTFEQNNIKVVNINSEDKLKLNESESEKKSEKKDKKNYLDKFQSHNTN